ncbi:YycH family regulatory protein [Bacillus sp. FJAT-45350]|uniref:YycH family regulatory protein n=1 Tax=Bacillus sp. FJAT-45350 TaxID=2011014 RepID=UPI0015CC2BA3|nr:two-component system activity regulator YycH [Bacillus sp. FJAT-45350]
MFDKAKTIILILLIVLSIVLTWQLWTFQPDYALLEDTGYITNEPISEERKLREVIVPRQMVIHDNEALLKVPATNREFTELLDTFYGAKLEQFTSINEVPSQNFIDEAVELILPVQLPSEILLNLFEVAEADRVFPINHVDRLIFYKNTILDRVQVRLVSYGEGRIIEALTDIQMADITFNTEGYIPVFPYQVGYRANDESYQPTIYLPLEEVEQKSVSYTSTLIPFTHFKQLFFSEPTSVKYHRQDDGEESYTDGNRMLNIIGNGNFMDYINPVYTDNLERGSKHIIQSSFEFINAHGGWTDQYQLFDWSGDQPTKDEAEYRLNLNGLPVLSVSGDDLMSLTVSRAGNQTARYARPLFDLDVNPIDTKKETLPSGEVLIEALEQWEFYDRSRLEQAVIGYEMKKRNAIVTVEPHWYILYNGVWQRVPFQEINEREGN